MDISAQQIIQFWYSTRVAKQWFSSTDALDSEIREKYGAVFNAASAGELDSWMHDASGCLALVILLDQFPLNMFRGKSESFQSEQRAVQIARYAIDHQYDKQIDTEKRAFLYMPFMHSEHLDDQALAVKLYTESGLQGNARFAKHHQEIVRKFGRFPHRNDILGRESTPEELDYLASENAFKG